MATAERTDLADFFATLTLDQWEGHHCVSAGAYATWLLM
jgi:hypothetical protein